MPVYVVKDIIQNAFDGTLQLTFLPALRSARAERSLRACRRTNPTVETAVDLLKFDLEVLDRGFGSLGAGVVTPRPDTTEL
jgi:hypothetical protein